MNRIKKIMVSFLLTILISVAWPVQGVADSSYGLDKVIAGSIEDDSWMYAKDREEVKVVLERYYTGPLLEELVVKCWDFIKLPTDWYSIAKLLDIKMIYIDGKFAVAEVVVRIEDVDTGKNELICGLLKLSNKSGVWKVYEYFYLWDDNR